MIFCVLFMAENNPGRGCAALIRVRESKASHPMTISRNQQPWRPDCSSAHRAAGVCAPAAVFMDSASDCAVKDKDSHKG